MAKKPTCEDETSMKTTTLLRLGFFRGGKHGMKLTRECWWGDEDVDVTVWLGDNVPTASLNGHTVRLTTTTPNYGGKRFWFVCPYCHRRVGVIYLSRQAACRLCFGLPYRSQQMPHGKGRAGDLTRDINLIFPKPNNDLERIRYKRWRGRPTKRIVRLEEKRRKLFRKIFKAKHNL